MSFIRAADDLLALINKVNKITRLNRSELTRRSIRLGAVVLARRYTGAKPALVEYLADFKGLEIPKRRHPLRPRT